MGRRLDAGCGTGNLSLKLARMGCSVTGVDISENMLAVLQNLDTYVNSEQEHIGITNVVLRLRQIFPDAAFTFCNRSGAGAQITIDFPYVPFFRIDG